MVVDKKILHDIVLLNFIPMIVSLMLNKNSNIIGQQEDLATIPSIGNLNLGELIGEYRCIKTIDFSHGTCITTFLEKIAEINFQEIADICTMFYGTGKAVTLPPILTSRGILVNYNRNSLEYFEKNMLFLKVILH